MSDDTPYDLNWIVSVDDHVIEPPNVWMDRLPAEVPATSAPGSIRESDGHEYWVYEDKKMVTGGLGATAGRPQGGHHRRGLPLQRDAAGLLRPGRAVEGHGRGRRAGLAELPVDPPLLRPAVLGGQGQGPGAPLREGLQRLDDRRVVRRRPRPLHPPHDHPAVGPGRGGQGDRAHRSHGVELIRLLGELRAPRPAHHPRPEPLLGPGPPGGQRHRPDPVDPHRVVVDHVQGGVATRPSWPTCRSG